MVCLQAKDDPYAVDVGSSSRFYARLLEGSSGRLISLSTLPRSAQMAGIWGKGGSVEPKSSGRRAQEQE